MTATSGLVIAAPASNQGKTVITLALLRHLLRRGIAVSSCKAGPDYIDPAFHAAASTRPCLNLDPWGMRRSTLLALATDAAKGAELVVCEGVMGLFDGAGAREGSTADLAMLLGWPVVMVMDVRGQAASAAACLRGFATHRNGLAIKGVIFNRVGGPGHAAVLREAVADCLPDVAVLGCLPRDPALALAERHLGLVQAGEHADLDSFLDRAASVVGEHLDIPALLGLAAPGHSRAPAESAVPVPPLGQRIAVARDAAFAFAYPALLEGWRRAGAELSFFSPLADEAPEAGADAVYLPGGYPELHAGRLNGNRRFLDGLRSAAATASVFGECGGYMVLGRGLIDAQGQRFEMAGLLALETSFAARRLHLGYRRAGLLSATALGPVGARYRGHEFHYASILAEGPGQPLFIAANAKGEALGTMGLVEGKVCGSFIHLLDAEGS